VEWLIYKYRWQHNISQFQLHEHVHCNQIHDVARLKSRLIEEWLRTFLPDDQLIIDEAVRQRRSRLRACSRACWGHFERKLLACVTFALWHSTTSVENNIGHFLPSVTSINLLVTIADSDKFYGNLVIYLQLDVTLLMQNLVKIWQRML